MKEKKEKSKSLKKLYAELLQYVSKTYTQDETICKFTSVICKKQEQIEQKRVERKLIIEKHKDEKKNVILSISTLNLCHNLIKVEKLHNELMQVKNDNLEVAYVEIKNYLNEV